MEQHVQSVISAVERQDMALDDQATIANAIQEACREWAETLRSVAMRGELGAPDWQQFELKIWELGESLRLFLKRKKKWRGGRTT